MRIAITTMSFGRYSEEPLNLLREAGVEYILNDKGRGLTEDESIQMLKGCVGVAAGAEPLTKKFIDACPNIKVISRCGTNTDNVDVAYASSKGIHVCCTPDGPTFAVAELAIGMMLNLLRHLSVMDREVHNGIWKKYMGSLLYCKRVGIVGFGRIGRALAERLLPFGVEIAFCDPLVEQPEHGKIGKMSLEELMSWADIVTLHCPKPENGQPLLDAGKLSLMRTGGFVINVARGGLVDEKAVYGMLKAGHLAGVALDVFAKEPYVGPLQELDNVILTPRIASFARESRVIMEVDTIKNLLAVIGS